MYLPRHAVDKNAFSSQSSKMSGHRVEIEHTLRCLIKLTVSTVWDFTGEQILCKSRLLHFIQNKRDNLNYTLKANICTFVKNTNFVQQYLA